MPARAVHRFLEVVPMNPARMFTSLIAVLSFVFILSACTPPTTGDTTRPTVISVTSTSNSSVNVVFSETIVGAGTASKFTITPALGVTAASISSDGQTVTLTTASQIKNTKYTLGVASSIKDTAGNLVNPTPATALAFTGRGGKLTVTITGLPAGVNPDVVMTEADTSSQQVTANSVVLDNVGSGALSFAVNAVKPDAGTFSDDSSPKSLNFVAGLGGSVALKYACSAVKPPDVQLDTALKAATGKQAYNCADLAKITKLSVFAKSISNIDGIQYVTGLSNLDLTSNTIRDLPANVFDQLTKLTGLQLGGNSIQNLPANIFDKLTQLTDLTVSGNEISVLPVGIFDKLGQLTNLDLNGNEISVLPVNIFDKLTKLTNLNLTFNQISVLPENHFDQLTKLTTLNLDFNQISVLPTNIFDKLTQLTKLGLSNNKFSVLPVSIFEKLTQLTFLDLEANCLATEQEPLKTPLSTFTGTIFKTNNPKAGCPQKTISILSIETQKLTTAHGSFAGENIYLKTRIDGVVQADGDPIFTTVKPGNPVSINQSLFVNSELRVELFTQDIAGDIKIGEATLSIDNPYTTGLVIVPLTENGAVYVLKLEKK
jgi:Leucine-rich repeat (LRR) protein